MNGESFVFDHKSDTMFFCVELLNYFTSIKSLDGNGGLAGFKHSIENKMDWNKKNH